MDTLDQLPDLTRDGKKEREIVGRVMRRLSVTPRRLTLRTAEPNQPDEALDPLDLATPTATPAHEEPPKKRVAMALVSTPSPQGPRKQAATVAMQPMPAREEPDTHKLQLLRGLPWDSFSCWLDVGVELLHTCAEYGLKLSPEAFPKTNARQWLHYQALQLRSNPDTTKVIAQKNARWAEANLLPGDVPPVGTFHFMDIGLLSLVKSDPDTVLASFVTTCPFCGFQKARSKCAFFTFPGEDYPSSWRTAKSCSACGRGGQDLEITVHRAPVFISLACAEQPKTASGRIPSLVHKFGEEYVLVFAPVNLNRDHFTAHIRLGNHWYWYDPGPGRRMLLSRDYGNPPFPPSGSLLGECLFVRRREYDVTAQRLETLLSADPVAGALEESPVTDLYKPLRSGAQDVNEIESTSSDTEAQAPQPKPKPAAPETPTAKAGSDSDNDVLTWTPPSQRKQATAPGDTSYLDREVSKEEINRILGIRPAKRGRQPRKANTSVATASTLAKRPAAGLVPSAKRRQTTPSGQVRLGKNFNVQRYAKQKNAPPPDDFIDAHTLRVEAKQAALSVYKERQKKRFLIHSSESNL